MNQRIAKKKLKQWYDDREELIGWLRELSMLCDKEYPIIDVNEHERQNYENSTGWGKELFGDVSRHFRLERAKLINAIRRW
jgi:hypothetical protein